MGYVLANNEILISIGEQHGNSSAYFGLMISEESLSLCLSVANISGSYLHSNKIGKV
jgi:hypothetical protein